MSTDCSYDTAPESPDEMHNHAPARAPQAAKPWSARLVRETAQRKKIERMRDRKALMSLACLIRQTIGTFNRPSASVFFTSGHSNVITVRLEFLVDLLHFLLGSLQTRAAHQFCVLLLALCLH